MTEETGRPLRADALRNRTRVLEAAEAVFAAEGLSVPVDVIAEKAGVGVGTLYRHFPTKEKLFEAILVARITEITEVARARLNVGDAGAAFFGFLEYLVGEAVLKRDLIMALADAGVEFEVAVAPVKEEMGDAVAALLRAAQDAGAVRADVEPEVVMSLIGATCMAAERPDMAVCSQAMVRIVCDGLKVSR
ncbi:MAG TPA: TetR/AcrR family transcriptional regulator [Acidimicrobiales bacterium]|nr:TetR/AcrR family transcriptional regulator [Acidimicrobiales bacterium]